MKSNSLTEVAGETYADPEALLLSQSKSGKVASNGTLEIEHMSSSDEIEVYELRLTAPLQSVSPIDRSAVAILISLTSIVEASVPDGIAATGREGREWRQIAC